MRIDPDTKLLLTVIAAALSVIAFRQVIGPADAQNFSCGRLDSPCAVVNVTQDQYDHWKHCFEMQRCYSVSIQK